MSSQPALAPAKPGPQLSLDQQRAQCAWRAAGAGVAEDKDYAKLTKSVPTLIMGSGLLQTMAYLRIKKHDVLFGQLARELKLGDDPIKKLVEMDPATYRAKTEAALALLRWLRHFAAVIAKDAKEETHG